ncbi:unnamed protein product [Alopecurus aequalis]
MASSSSKASDSSSHRDGLKVLGVGTSGSAALHGKLTQLKRQIQSARLASVREKMEANRRALQRHTCGLFDVAAAAEVASRGADGGNVLSQLAADGQSRRVGWDLARGSGEREVVHLQEDNLSAAGTLDLSSSDGNAQRTLVRLVTLPLVDKIPPYTTWIFLDKNQRMADDQSIAGRRRIYYDSAGNEALICSESDEEIPLPEEEKHVFTEGEDKLIWKATQENGLSQEDINVICQFIDASPLEIEVFDCRLHGCSQNLVFPSEKQPYMFELDGNKTPCGDQCYLQRREGLQDMHKYDCDASATHNMESRPASHKFVTDIMSESEDSNREEEVMKSSIFVGTSSSKTSFESAEKHTTLPPGDTSETENISTDTLLRSLGKRKISKGPRSSDDFPYKKPRMLTSDIPSASHILNKLSISEIGDARPDFREFGGNQLDDTNKKTSNKDSFGGSLTSTTEDAARNINKETSANNMFSSSREHTLSRWSVLERDLYLKGIEIFGKNSCLIARNMLCGLKTCMEVASYMYNNGAAVLCNSISGDFAETDQDYMEQGVVARTRICRRRGRTRKYKYPSKAAGHPAIRKRVGDGKQCDTQYTPCGCQQMCSKTCPCAENGTCCEKYCGCSKSCKNRFRGCHCAKSQCRSRQCPCFAASRECDPDVCRNCWVSCGDGSLGEPSARGDGYQCGNMKLLLKQQQRILLGKSDVAGWGAFIKNPVHKNDYLGEYTGELISHKEADKRGKIYDRANSSFLFDLNDQFVLDAYRKGDKLKFANHSASPNCFAKVMMVAGDHRVGIYAREHIEASAELFYDYRYGPDQAPAWARRPEGSKKDEASGSHRRAHKVAR